MCLLTKIYFIFQHFSTNLSEKLELPEITEFIEFIEFLDLLEL